MEESPRSRMTFGQALARQWQVPLFIFSLALFATVLLRFGPTSREPSFEEQFSRLAGLAQQERYKEFYPLAEQLRLMAKTQEQLGRVHALAARTRARELRQLHQLGVGPSIHRTAAADYEHIIDDYTEGLRRGVPAADTPEGAEAFRDLAQAFWCLNDAERAVTCLERAISAQPGFDAELRRMMVRMLLAARPKGYLGKCLEYLEEILAEQSASPDARAWAFVRKAEVLIAQGNEDQALQLLKQTGPALQESKYGNELELLRGRALHRAGEADRADIVLRDLLKRITDRGDVYAQTALELGKINLEQYRDHEARRFFESVTGSQSGKDWYAAAELGLAETTALQQRYDESLAAYGEVVELLRKNPHNRAVAVQDVQHSLAVLAQQLALLKRYDLALPFLEIEQKIAPAGDVGAAERFARLHARAAEQIRRQTEQARRDGQSTPPTEKEKAWFEQQHRLMAAHFETAAEHYVRVASLAFGDDRLYGDSLWRAAECYDKAGNTDKAIELWQRFVAEREGWPRWPFALFHLAQAYQALGEFDQAIGTYQTLRRKHPKSPATFDAMVPLARCYLAQEPPDRTAAEKILQSVLVDRALTPQAPHFRAAMFELGELYYNSKKYTEAISILTEAIDRYPDDDRLGKMMFLVADSYRRSGLALNERLAQLAQDPTGSVGEEKVTIRRTAYLEHAREYFDRAIQFYSKMPAGRRTKKDKMYLRHCWLYRANCLYDLGRYQKAAEAYEQTVLHYQLSPTALSAFVQIINCQLKLGNDAEARSTNERALWQLRKMPDEALACGPVYLTRQQWSDWFNWTQHSGLW